MSKAIQNTTSEERKKKAQEKREREIKEKKELERKRKEKIQKEKAKVARIKVKEKREIKRINELIRFPFKILFQVSFLFSVLFFIVLLFGRGDTIVEALFSAFLLFTALYLGVGVLIVAITYSISEDKKKELAEQKLKEEEQNKIDEEIRIQKINQIEQDIKEAEQRRSTEIKRLQSVASEPVESGFDANEFQDEAIDDDMTLPDNYYEQEPGIPTQEFFEDDMEMSVTTKQEIR